MTAKRFPRFVQSWNRQDGAYIFDRQIPTKYNSIWVCMDIMNDLAEENEELKYSLSVYMVDLNKYKDRCSVLEQENEKLKKDLEHCANIFTDDGKNLLLSLR